MVINVAANTFGRVFHGSWFCRKVVLHRTYLAVCLMTVWDRIWVCYIRNWEMPSYISDSYSYSGVKLRPWTFLWDLTLHLLIWIVLHINRSLHHWYLFAHRGFQYIQRGHNTSGKFRIKKVCGFYQYTMFLYNSNNSELNFVPYHTKIAGVMPLYMTNINHCKVKHHFTLNIRPHKAGPQGPVSTQNFQKCPMSAWE